MSLAVWSLDVDKCGSSFLNCVHSCGFLCAYTRKIMCNGIFRPVQKDEKGSVCVHAHVCVHVCCCCACVFVCLCRHPCDHMIISRGG